MYNAVKHNELTLKLKREHFYNTYNANYKIHLAYIDVRTVRFVQCIIQTNKFATHTHTHTHKQGVPWGMCQTSGECSLR